MATVTIGKTGGFISGETVTPEKLNLLGTPTVALSNDEVTTAKILDGAVTAGKLATGAVTGAAGGGKLAASAITGQTTIADALADGDEFLVHDASASALRKVAYSSIAPTVTAAKLDGVAKDGSGGNLSAGTAPIFGCRAWVNFDGTKDTTGAASTSNTNRLIRASGNVASVLRTAQGKYTVTLTTSMPDASYVVVGNAAKHDVTDDGNMQVQAHGFNNGSSNSDAAGSFNIVVASGTTARDSGVVSVAVLR